MKKAILAVAMILLFAVQAYAGVGAGTVVLGTSSGGRELDDSITVRFPTKGSDSSILTGLYTRGDETSFAVSARHIFDNATAFDNASQVITDNGTTGYFMPLAPKLDRRTHRFAYKIYNPKSSKAVFITFTYAGGTPTGTITGIKLKNN